MGNNWKKIWEKRKINYDKLNPGELNTLFMELKRADGFDVMEQGISLDSFFEQYAETKAKLLKYSPNAHSVFEVGCGAGANLLLFENEGWKVGGIDYSEILIDTAKKVLNTNDIICASADAMPEEPQYDCILSNSVFSYFPDLDYTETVLKKMCLKAKHSIVLIDLHDAERKDAFIAYRKKTIPDYDTRYQDLPKFFFKKSFFEKFAQKKDLSIEIYQDNMKDYWNSPYLFNVALYKK